MSIVQSNVSPMHINCTIGQPYGNPDTSYSCGFHTGVDFPATGTSESNPDLYSCVEDGEVVYTYTESQGTTPSLGNQVQIKDNRTGRFFRYCHMLYGSIVVQVGDRVTTSTKLGKMGNTGNSTGTHLHLECSTTEAWQCGTFLNPGEILGFGNVRGTIIEYSGSPTSGWISRDSALNETEMKHNADILISYYRSQGINDKTIAGILANMQAESTINPGRQEVGGQGYGLVQWTPVSVLQNHCSTLGLSPYTDGDVQIRVLLSEIRNEPNVEEWYSSVAFIENYYNSGATSDMIGITGSQFLSNSMNWDADKLAIMFMVAYERPSYDPNINHYQLRQMLALIWYTYISGITTNNNSKKWLMCRAKNIRIKI